MVNCLIFYFKDFLQESGNWNFVLQAINCDFVRVHLPFRGTCVTATADCYFVQTAAFVVSKTNVSPYINLRSNQSIGLHLAGLGIIVLLLSLPQLTVVLFWGVALVAWKRCRTSLWGVWRVHSGPWKWAWRGLCLHWHRALLLPWHFNCPPAHGHGADTSVKLFMVWFINGPYVFLRELFDSLRCSMRSTTPYHGVAVVQYLKDW